MHTAIIQRGSDGMRVSTIEVEACKHQGQVTEMHIGGNAVMVGEGKIYLDLI